MKEFTSPAGSEEATPLPLITEKVTAIKVTLVKETGEQETVSISTIVFGCQEGEQCYDACVSEIHS